MYSRESSSFSLDTCIRRICSDAPPDSIMLPFVRLCTKLSLGYLHHRRQQGQHISENIRPTRREFEDIAVDAIADLFQRNDAGVYTVLRRYLSRHLEEIEIDEAWLLPLRRLITSRTRQALHRIFRERDPEGGKILRGIKIAVSKNPRLHGFQDGHRQRVCFGAPRKRVTPLEDPIDIEILQNRCFQRFSPRDTIPILLAKIREAWRTLGIDANTLDIAEIAAVIRRYRSAIRENHDFEPNAHRPDVWLDQHELQREILSIEVRLCRKIDEAYSDAGKLDGRTASAMKSALRRMLHDIVQGSPLETNFTYLSESMPDLKQDDYYSDLHKKFEYIVKIMKRELKKRSAGKSE